MAAGAHSEKDPDMNPVKVVAIALIVAGVLGLLYGGFSYTKETHDVKIGPIELSVKEKQDVNIPVWAGIGAIVVGGLLLVFGSKKG
jgi:multidrug transporter EmrE-like cation transporter